MATTSSTAGTAADDSSIGSVAPWTNASNATGAANGTTSTSAAPGGEPAISNRLKLTNFSFDAALATASAINGITAVVRKKRLSGQNCKDYQVKLLKSGSVVGNSLADTTNNWSTSLADVTYGGASNLWGTTWSGSDFTSTFGIGIVADFIGYDAIAYIDCVTITVDYTASGGGDVWIQNKAGSDAAAMISTSHRVQIVNY